MVATPGPLNWDSGLEVAGAALDVVTPISLLVEDKVEEVTEAMGVDTEVESSTEATVAMVAMVVDIVLEVDVMEVCTADILEA